MDCNFYSAFLVIRPFRVLYSSRQYSFIHTHSCANARGFSTKCQPAHKEHAQTHTHRWSSRQEQFGVQCLPKVNWRIKGSNHLPSNNWTTSVSWAAETAVAQFRLRKILCFLLPVVCFGHKMRAKQVPSVGESQAKCWTLLRIKVVGNTE